MHATFARGLASVDGPDSLAPLVRALGFRPLATPHPHGPVLLVGERRGARAAWLPLEDDERIERAGSVIRALRDSDLSQHALLIAAAPRGGRRVVFATWGVDGEVRLLAVDRLAPRRSDLDALVELVPERGEGASALSIRYARALDRSRVGHRFFQDFRDCRAAVSAAWRGVPRAARAERDQLALLLLCRLMFLYFLQRGRHLAGDPAYLLNLLRRWQRAPGGGTFYAAVLAPLFFGALNRRPEKRTAAARALGRLPYLNGGLFERHALERRYPRLDLPDTAAARAFEGLLERYRFTTTEPVEGGDAAMDAAIDPEMLGRVFEGLMAESRRSETGTFFTPAPVVDRLVSGALAAHLCDVLPSDVAAGMVAGRQRSIPAGALRGLKRRLASLRVLDPACGSGAFLLGALARITRLRIALDGADAGVRRDVVGNALHGVDVQPDAALLCALRLWLALAVEDGATEVQPLPNLDRRVRQGDALLDPLDLACGGGMPDPAVRRCIRALGPVASRYLDAEPGERERLRDVLSDLERDLASAWIDSLSKRIARGEAEMRAASQERDLFGEPSARARTAQSGYRDLVRRRSELERLATSLDEGGAVPFFSFPVHFAAGAAAGFDLVLSNPPWVRAHRWPAALARIARSRYEVCRAPGWSRGARLAGAPAAAAAQIDLALLFLERSLSLLATGGTLGFLLPAKVLRSLFGGSARRMLLRDTRLVSVEDHGLDHRSVFRADAFTAAIIARKAPATAPPTVAVTLIRRRVKPLTFDVPQDELPLLPGDLEAPWLLVPPDVRDALRAMQRAGPPIALQPGMSVRRGVFTGANAILLVREARPRIGGLATFRAEGWFARSAARNTETADAKRFEGLVEGSALRPVTRGADIAAWRFRSPEFVVWLHGQDGTARPPAPRLARYLARHEALLRRRSGSRAGTIPGALFRVTAETLMPKVAWHDLAETLNAVALPATVRSTLGETGPLVPLNTVYFIPMPDPARARLLTAYLNSLPVRTFARAIAERAKDARFRFFAWTLACLPLPDAWDRGETAARLARISAAAHEGGGIGPAAQRELDGLVADAFRLTPEQRDALASFDQWLRGVP